MTRIEQVRYLNRALLGELPQYQADAAQYGEELPPQRALLRALMNVRAPRALDAGFVAVQDALLQAERDERGVVDADALPATAADARLALWQGDITRLAADAIVNAANSALLGCFVPGHHCIDNAIHSAAGLQLREECAALMRAQGHEEPTGSAKLTRGYNLPARYVLHTVGPIVRGAVTARDRALLASCYRSCLALAEAHGLHSVAFCCISTGVFCFPNEEAARIAVETVRGWLPTAAHVRKVIFNVFLDKDLAAYQKLLGGIHA